MAPTAPTPRKSLLPTRRDPSHRPNTIATSDFSTTKKDKRQIKHSLLVSRIEKAHAKPLKRRRPNKKLVTTLESLGDALEGVIQDGGMGEGGVEEGKMRMRGLKSRPGAMKRREKVERLERERFGRNLGVLMKGVGKEGKEGGDGMNVEGLKKTGIEDKPQSSTAGRWAALRGFITQTMEQKEEFATQAKA